MKKVEREKENSSIIYSFKKQVKTVPEKTALVYREQQFTYRELDEITDGLAAYLQQKGIGKGDVVSVLIPRCEYMLITALGILKAGAAYQPLDASHPFERICFMMEDAKSSLVIVAKDMESLLGEIQTDRLYMEDIAGLKEEKDFLLPEITAEDVFVLLYTSGSTGVPKGCILEHGNLLSFAKWYVSYYEVDASCKMAEHASFVFDVSMMELFMPLTAGAAVHIIPEEIRTDLQALNAYFEENGITHASMTTQLGRQFAANIENHSLLHLTVAGEALVPIKPPANYHLHNGYGPTEGTILLTIQQVDRYYENSVPIGKPLDEVEIYVVNADGQQVKNGEPGELCAAGPHITRGYLHQPEQTALVYEKNPFSRKCGYERMYHTGDIVRYNEDGLLEYMGRADRQVKIRGYRIELPEIEAVLRQYKGIQDATVSALEAGEEKYLAAYYVAEEEIPEEELRAFMLLKKPAYMVPAYFIRLKEIPLNTNGKVDKNRLPVPNRNQWKAEYEKPRTATEEKLAHLYEKLLAVEGVGRRDHFLKLGGHSLLAAKLLFEMEKEFHCSFSMKTIMEYPVLADLAKQIEKACAKGIQANLASAMDRISCAAEEAMFGQTNTPGIYPASAAQKRMYTAQMLCEKTDTSYNLPVILHIGKKEDTLTYSNVEKILGEMFCRHEVLRTGLRMNNGILVQEIYPDEQEWSRDAVKRSYIALPQNPRLTKQELLRDFVQPFSMELPPLFHWSYVEREEEVQIFFDWHHSICDGTSIELFCQEFMALWQGKVLQMPELQYKDFAVWEKKQNKTGEKMAWAEHLQMEIPVLDLKPDYAHQTVQRHQGEHIQVSLSKRDSQKLQNFCRQYAVTDNMCLFAGYFLLLQKYTQQQNMCIGTVMSGRTREELVQMQGMFVNTVPIWGSVKEEDTFLQLMEQVKQEIVFAYAYQDCPLEEIAKELLAERTPSGNLLFDVLFVMQGFARSFSTEKGITAELEFVTTQTAMYDLTLEVELYQDCYVFDFEYNRELFAPESIQLMAQHYVELLVNAMDMPQMKLGEISFLSGEEEEKLLVGFQGAHQEVSQETVVEALLEQTKKNPDKTAVIFGERQLSYQQLLTGAKHLARQIGGHISPEGFCVVFAERSLEMLAAIWGILYAKGAYVPVSPEYPTDRIQFILEDCKPEIIITCKAVLPDTIQRFAAEKKIPIVDIVYGLSEDDLQVTYVQEEQPKQLDKKTTDKMPQPKQLAYMIYTSGTTGVPKGVMVEHAQLSHLLGVYTDIYGLHEKDCVLQYANFVFDQSVWDIFHILVLGGTLCLIPPEIVKDPEALEEYCREKKVTAASLTPGFLRVLHAEKFPTLRILDVGGEAPDRELLMAWAKNRRVFNTYGPTETTVNATSFLFDGKDRRSSNVPIGKAIPNTQVYILQGERLAGIGVPGELCIAGNGVTRGYLHREELTAEKYVNNPFGSGKMYRSGDLARYLPDGNIEFLGRMDEQVKIRGYRIELGEIEAQMLAVKQVKEAVVIVSRQENGDALLCGYYTVNETFSEEMLKEVLQERLPAYMVPAACILLDKIPLTVNGKVNKRALPKPKFQGEKKYVPAKTEKEKQCVSVWEDVLGISPIGINEEFLALGGDSIKAIRVVSKLRELGYQLEIKDVMLYKTVQTLARHMRCQEEQKEYDEEREILWTPVIQQFVQGNLPYPEQYNQSVILKFQKTLNLQAIKQALEALRFYHGALRLLWKKDMDKDSFIVQKYEEAKTLTLQSVILQKEEEMKDRCRQLQSEIYPQKGEVVRVQHFYVKESDADYLFMAVHHLAVDEVSWGILLEDLNCLYRRACEKQIHPADAAVILPSKTVSFGEWTRLCRAYGESRAFAPEKEYWENFATQELSSHSAVEYFRESEQSGKSFVTEYRNLSADKTKALATLAENTYHTRLDGILLAVLMGAVRALTGETTMLVQMESHGRGSLHCPVRTDRTVGWFTAVYPIRIDFCQQLEEQIVLCKEVLNVVPNYGTGYGLLQQQKNLPLMGKGFVMNYLGQSRNTDFGEFSWLDMPMEMEIHPQNGDAETITWNVRVDKTGMEIQCCYDSCFSKERIAALLDRILEILEATAKEQNPDAVVYTPSDLSMGKKMTLAEWQLLKNRISLESVECVCALTPLQQGMFYHWLANPKKREYCIYDKVTWHGTWNEVYFRQSLELVTEKYDILRSRICLEGMEQPWQVIDKAVRIEFSVLTNQSIEDVVKQERDRGFDLTRDVLFRVYAFPIHGQETELLIAQHHVITDGWSFPLVLESLERYYDMFCDGASWETVRAKMLLEKENICSFSEYVYWREKQDMTEGIAYWKNRLGDYTDCVGIEPYGKPEEVSGNSGEEQLSLTLSPKLQHTLQNVAKTLGITKSVIFETAWGILLQRENNTKDVVFGKTVSGRNGDLSGIEEAVGPFINTIPVRVTLEQESTLAQLLIKQQQLSLEAASYEQVSLAEIQTQAAPGSTLFQTLYVYENYYVKEQKSSSFSYETLQEETNYPVSLCVDEGEHICLHLIWDAELYKKEQMQTILHRLEFIIGQIAYAYHSPVDELENIPPREIEKMLVMAAGEKKIYPKKTILRLLKEAAVTYAQKEAVRMNERSLTYRELHQAGCHQAEKLGFGGERYVVILAERSLEMIAAICGTLYAGAAYVPVDPTYPLERIQYIIEDCQPVAILTKLPQTANATEDKLCTWLKTQQRIPVYPVELKTDGEETVLPCQNVFEEMVKQEDMLWNRAAYVIYTSGTTGQPKGVVITHGSLSNMIYSNADFYQFCSSDRVLQLANYVFDQSVMEIFNTLAAGGILCLITKKQMETAEGIEDYCRKNEVSVLIGTSVLLGTLHAERMGHLRLVDTGGDVAQEEVYRSFAMADFISNSYGPTETTVNATTFCFYARGKENFASSYRSIPIGRPLANKCAFVMQGNKMCGIGMKGELCITGEGLAREYLHQKDLTEKHFITNPFGQGKMYRTGDVACYLPDGNLIFCGRMDGQVKIRGFRIEPAEIEQCLRQMEEIDEAAVICCQDASGSNYLSGFLVAESKINLAAVKEKLGKSLPAYMIPTQLQQLECLPLNQSGKLDVRKLSECSIAPERAYEAPATYFEEICADAFAKILHKEYVGREDSFFDLGGNSIDAMKLVSLLAKDRIQVSELMQYQTPEKLGKVLAAKRAGQNTKEQGFTVLQEGDARYPSLFCLPPSGGMTMCYYELLRQWEYPGFVYGMSDMKFGKYETASLQDMWTEVNNSKDMWTETLLAYQEAIVKVWKNGDILMGYSQGGSIALRLADFLEKQGYLVKAVLMLESEPFTGQEESREDNTKEILDIVYQTFWGEPLESADWKDVQEEQQIGEYFQLWAEQYEKETMLDKEICIRNLTKNYLVVKKNISYPLLTRGKVHCPIYALQIDEHAKSEIQRCKANPWESYTQAESICYGIRAKEEEHLVFLTRYKQEIAEICKKLLET